VQVLGVVLFIVGLGAAIAIHEWGHLITAKRYGMRADRYFVGFGPTIWSTHRGETEYGVKWLLFGGYVRIKGMSPTDERLAPVAEAVLAPDAVAEHRRELAEREGRDLSTVPALPEATWDHLHEELLRRGVSEEDRRWLVERTRADVGTVANAHEAAARFAALAEQRLPDTGRVGDVRHRVLRGDEDRFFHDRPARERAVVLSAGSISHFLQAVLLLFVAFWAFGVQPSTEIEEVFPGAPAEEAGLESGDRILAVDGAPVRTFDTARGLLAGMPGEQVTLTIDRDGETTEVELMTSIVVDDVEPASSAAEAGVAPRDRITAVDGAPLASPAELQRAAAEGREVTLTLERFTAEGEEVVVETAEVAVGADALAEIEGRLIGQAGFVPSLEGMGPITALRESFVGEGGFVAMFVGTFEAFGALVGPEGLGAIPAQLAGGERDPTGASLASPIGLAQVAGEGTAAAGLFFLLGLLAAINVFIGIFNLLPLPPLDGGHLAVLAVERSVNTVRGWRGQPADYRVDPRTISAIALPVIFLLGVLFLAVIVLDITNPLRLPQ
jgi:RIP metalloprotease RseP